MFFCSWKTVFSLYDLRSVRDGRAWKSFLYTIVSMPDSIDIKVKSHEDVFTLVPAIGRISLQKMDGKAGAAKTNGETTIQCIGKRVFPWRLHTREMYKINNFVKHNDFAMVLMTSHM